MDHHIELELEDEGVNSGVEPIRAQIEGMAQRGLQ
jgi:hypothetical protein